MEIYLISILLLLLISFTNLTGLYLSRSDLSNANFYGKNISGSEFQNANLSNANLSNANIKGDAFNYANLNGADLTDAIIDDKTNFKDALYNSNTKGLSDEQKEEI